MAAVRAHDKTLVATVLFTDIVRYSTLSLDNQTKIKRHFVKRLKQALHLVDAKERVVSDTGDGAAICFLGEPELAILAAMNMEQTGQNLPYQLRQGLHIGTVRLIRDASGKINVVGDGINACQRVMSFCEPGETFASQAYVATLTGVADEYQNLFQDIGSRSDKHGREHALFRVNWRNPMGRAPLAGEPGTAPVEQPVSAPSSRPDTLPVAFAPERLASLEKLLTIHIGPIAPVLVRRSGGLVNGSWEALCDRLAEEIDDLPGRQEFLEAVRAL